MIIKGPSKRRHSYNSYTVELNGIETLREEYSNTSSTLTELVRPDRNYNNPEINGFRKPSPWFGRKNGRFEGASVDEPIRFEEGSAPGNIVRASGHLSKLISGVIWTHSVRPDYNKLQHLRTKLLNDVRQENLDVAMVLAEMSSTVDLIGDGLMKIGRAMDTVKRGYPRHYSFLLTGRRPALKGARLSEFNKRSSELWLSYAYGVTPTVLDIQGACASLEEASSGLFSGPPRLVARANEKWESGFVNPSLSTGDDRPGPTLDLVGARPRLVAENELHARCDFMVDGDLLRGLNRYGLGLSTVPTLLFERTPFSFVLNMAVPIASMLKAWTALAGTNVLGYSETQFVRTVVEWDSFPSAYRFGGYLGRYRPQPITVPGGRTSGAFAFERKVYPEPPMPMPYVRNPIKPRNLATVLALFTTLRKT